LASPALSIECKVLTGKVAADQDSTCPSRPQTGRRRQARR